MPAATSGFHSGHSPAPYARRTWASQGATSSTRSACEGLSAAFRGLYSP